ncbi:zinc finger BED domain-containing protein RICESLEEPER 2 [Tanacetum coccineum]
MYCEKLKTDAQAGQASMSREGGIFAYEAELCRQQFESFVIQEGREAQFPVLAAMARDLLSVQASTVASESDFSTSGSVLSIRRTRLTPAYLEMFNCLKDHLDAAERVQHIASLEDRLEYKGKLHDVEVTTSEAYTISDEELGLDEATSEARSSEAEEEDINLEQALI